MIVFDIFFLLYQIIVLYAMEMLQILSCEHQKELRRYMYSHQVRTVPIYCTIFGQSINCSIQDFILEILLRQTYIVLIIKQKENHPLI